MQLHRKSPWKVWPAMPLHPRVTRDSQKQESFLPTSKPIQFASEFDKHHISTSNILITAQFTVAVAGLHPLAALESEIAQ